MSSALANRRRLIQAILFLVLVFGLVDTLADGARSLTLSIIDSRIERIEVVQGTDTMATLEFVTVPHEHVFRLPAGAYELRASGRDGLIKFKRIDLQDDKELVF